MMKSLLLFFTCLFLPSLCFSQKWVNVANGNDCLIDIDLSSIKREGDLIYVTKRTKHTTEKARREYIDGCIESIKKYEYNNQSVPLDVLKKWANYSHSLVYVVYDTSNYKMETLIGADCPGLQYFEFYKYENPLIYQDIVSGDFEMTILDFLSTMLIYEVDGRRAKVYVEKVEDFLSLYPNAKYLWKDVEPSSLPIWPNSNIRPEWEEVASNDRQLIEADLTSIKRADKTVSAWIKTTYKKDMDYYIDKMLDQLRKTGHNEDRGKWENWKYTVSYQEFNYDEGTFTLVSVTHYNANGTVIGRIDTPEDERTKIRITPDTLMSQAAFLLCSKFIFDVNGKKYAIPIEEYEAFEESYPNAVYLGSNI